MSDLPRCSPCQSAPVLHGSLQLLHLDEHLAVVNKPAGWLVHASPIDRGERRIVLQALRDQLGRAVWPLHRLDKGTSGALAFALDPDTARTIGRAFDSGHGVRKTYRAIVRGWPGLEQLIDHPLTRMADDQSGSREPVQAAQTRLYRMRQGTVPIADQRHDQIRIAEVQLQPLTGRRHQLRRHMKHIAHPIIGDATHGKGPLNRSLAAHLGVSRLWLHAASLELPPIIDRPPIRVEAPSGDEWRVWDRLMMQPLETGMTKA